MKSVIIVKTKKELESALDKGVSKIVVQNKDLADNIRIVKAASRITLTAALVAGGLTTTNFWNPIGWVSGVATTAISATLITAIIALGIGITLIWIIYNDYSIKVKGKAKMPDGTEVEGEIVLEKN
ncbi:MAG: hypothetical protein IE881_09430 [Epsilonproteobacteria bacterium]|nr:hypothetical protein [Campylobacterota bacterium]